MGISAIDTARSRSAFSRIRALLPAAFIAVLSTGAASKAIATAAGPDEWAVTGVRTGSALTIRAKPSVYAPKIGKIPHDGRGLTNLGCTGEPSYAEWEKMSDVQREHTKRRRWCRIRYQGIEGWVWGIYLREGS